MVRAAFSLLILFVFAAAASAAELDDAALALFESGDYRRAAEAGAEAGGPDNLALAARCLNAYAYLTPDDGAAREATLAALDYAQAAIAAEDDFAEAHLLAAVSHSLRAARMSAVRAVMLGLAGKARERLDAALALDPDNAWALSSSAAWHMEISRQAGDGRFGSDAELGFQQFGAALAADPGNVAIAYEAALRTLAIDRPAWRDAALQALDIALTAAPRDAFDAALQSRARALAAAVAAGRDAERAFIAAQP